MNTRRGISFTTVWSTLYFGHLIYPLQVPIGPRDCLRSRTRPPDYLIDKNNTILPSYIPQKGSKFLSNISGKFHSRLGNSERWQNILLMPIVRIVISDMNTAPSVWSGLLIYSSRCLPWYHMLDKGKTGEVRKVYIYQSIDWWWGLFDLVSYNVFFYVVQFIRAACRIFLKVTLCKPVH